MKRIAVIGAGIAGLTAAYLLGRRHAVSLFEREARLGGHTNTIRIATRDGELALDTGFLVHNQRTYPNLVRLFAELQVTTRPSDMSFSVRCPSTGFEYSSRGALGFFAQPRNVVRMDHYRLLRDIVRFNREAPQVLTTPGAQEWTLGDFVERERYGEAFTTQYLVPMTSAIWSASVDSMAAFPVQTLVRFMQNHGMLSVASPVAWRVVQGGSDSYIAGMIGGLGERVHLDARLQSVTRSGAGIAIAFADRLSERFDEVIFACHGDQVLPLLADPTAAERSVLGEFQTTVNQTVLHTDARMLPRSRRARASWNYLLDGDPGGPPSVTYDLNRLQGIAGGTTYCVTLNPRRPIDPSAVIRQFEYRHPQFTRASIAAQARWSEVSGVNHTHYCGAYWGYGFHEDGVVSAQRVAADLEVRW
ncbi:MAG: FAD-dependent oxidoreductase [Vicinamibacterales bacterium]